MRKNSFTLIEVLISIALLAIIVVFLYQALDITTKSNKFFSKKLLVQNSKSKIKNMFFIDIIHSESNVTKITLDKNKNSLFTFQTTNTYHSPFYKNITYFISKKNNLIRIESKLVFNKDKLFYSFFKNAYIDTIANDIVIFKIIKQNKKYSIYIKFKDETDMMFSVKSIR
jgi:prepilin-type N-terminal cleavage/methylation domain-containing protein